MKRWLWLGGWGFPVTEMQRIVSAWRPEVEHVVLPPDPRWRSNLQAAFDERPVDRLLGYSLGTMLLLRESDSLPATPVTLFAPILDFRAESGQGGRFEGRRLTILIRWLRRDPMAALKDFAQQAGMRDRSHLTELPYALDDLIWGIEQLRQAPATRAVETMDGFIGAEDKLLDAERIHAICPQWTVLPSVGHDIEDLLPQACQAGRFTST